VNPRIREEREENHLSGDVVVAYPDGTPQGTTMPHFTFAELALVTGCVDPRYGPPTPELYWAQTECGVIAQLDRAFEGIPAPVFRDDLMLASIVAGPWAGRDVSPCYQMGVWAVCELGIDKHGNHGWCAVRLSNLDVWDRVAAVGTNPDGTMYTEPCVPEIITPIFDDDGNEIPFALVVD